MLNKKKSHDPTLTFLPILPKLSQQPDTALRKLILSTFAITYKQPKKKICHRRVLSQQKSLIIKGPNFDIPPFHLKGSQQPNKALRKLIPSNFAINGF